MRSRSGLLAPALALALLTAGCGDGSDSTTTQSVASTTGDSTTPTAITLPEHDAGAQGAGQASPNASVDQNDSAVEQTISAVLAQGDPTDACSDLVTERYVTQTYGSEQGCREAQSPNANATDIKFTTIAYDGDTATTTIQVTGGVLDGQSPQVSLVDEGGVWKLDSLESDIAPGP